ncbi:hypothetical protein JCM3766R1_000756 [Sporobolomyces carnicolor]
MHLDHPPPCPPSCDHCLAFDNITRALCSRTPSPRSKWCSVHEELQAKLLKTYKRYSLAVDAFDDSVLPKNIDAIVNEDDLVQLRSWSESCRQKWSLVRRVVVARAEHHQQFYAGGDWGHCLFVETLKDESLKLERFLRALDHQAYSVNLAKSSASWILAVPRGPKFVCDDVAGSPATPASRDATERAKLSSHGLLTPPPSPPSPAEQSLPTSSSDAASSPTMGPAPIPSMNKNQRKAARRKALRKKQNPSSSPPTSNEEDDDDLLSRYGPSTANVASPYRGLSAREILSHLRAYLEFPRDLPTSVQPRTWRDLVEGLFRHVVLRIPSLANLALHDLRNGDSRLGTGPESTNGVGLGGAESCVAANFGSIESFLASLEAQLDDSTAATAAGGAEEQVEKLWKGLKFARSSEHNDDDEEWDSGLLGVGVLADVLTNVFRAESADGADDESARSIEILGGRVFKESVASAGDTWTREGWDLFYAFIACSGCALIATRSVSTWTTNRRLAALGHYPAWMSSSSSSEVISGTADKVLRLSRIVLCGSNSGQSGRKVKRIESKEKVSKGKKKIIFVEEWERNWMYVKMPADDPQSRLVLDTLSSMPHRFSILSRDAASGEIVHAPTRDDEEGARCSRTCSCCPAQSVWLNKVRSGLTPIERKTARWSTTSYFPVDSVLTSLARSSSPEARFHSEPYPDALDCLILDSAPYASATHDEWATFADSVARAVLLARGFETPSELTRFERKGAIERGEMASGEWEKMCAAATTQEDSPGGRDGKGPRGAKGRSKGKDGSPTPTKVVYVCEEELTARNVFRESF